MNRQDIYLIEIDPHAEVYMQHRLLLTNARIYVLSLGAIYNYYRNFNTDDQN